MTSNAVLERERQGTTESRPARRWWSWGVVAVYWLGMFGGTHYPTPPHTPFGNADKWMHFGAYCGLAFLVAIATGMRRPVSLAVGLSIVILLAGYGAFDETTQPLVGRDCDLWDWYADMAGTLVGLGLFRLGVLAQHKWSIRTAG
jgi:VanZ family protein